MPEQRHLPGRPQAAPTLENPLVVVPEACGLRVYRLGEPGKYHEVFGPPERPQCTCPEFQSRHDTRHFRCEHIEAVFRHLASSAWSEWRQGGSGGGQAARVQPNVRPGIRLMLRRTVWLQDSESLIVGLSVPLPEGGKVEIHQRLAPLLDTLQEAIEACGRRMGIHAESTAYRSRNGSSHQRKRVVLPVRLLHVQPMLTRKGRRHVLHLEASGQKLRLVGTSSELTAHLTRAGYGHLIGHIATGQAMNAPCRAVLVQRKRYLAVLGLLPHHRGEGGS